MSIVPEFEKALKLLKDMDAPSVVEVGAHIGDGVLAMLKANKCAKIIAIEPGLDNFQKLKTRVPKSVRCLNMGVSSAAEEIKFYSMADGKREYSRNNCFYKTVVKHKGVPAGCDRLNCLPLDRIVSGLRIETIGFIRFDCYGAEYKIFDGETEFIDITEMILITMHKSKELFCDKEYAIKRERIVDRLSDAGFKKIYGQGLRHEKHIHQLWVKK